MLIFYYSESICCSWTKFGLVFESSNLLTFICNLKNSVQDGHKPNVLTNVLDPDLCMSLMLFASEPSIQGKTWIFNVKKKQEPKKKKPLE